MQKAADVRLHVIALRKELTKSETFELNGVVFHLIKTHGGLRAPTLFWSDTWAIKRVLRTVRPDLVHAWGTERGAGLIASRLGYPYILTMHGLLSWLAELTRLDLYHRFARLLERPSLRRASTVTVESAFGERYLKERYPHLDLHQVEHAPLPLFHQIHRRPRTEPMRILFVGSFTQGKGADITLRALDRFKERSAFELVVVGHPDTTLVRRLESDVSADMWRRVRFAGGLSAQEIAEELAVATMMLYPTRCDNSPNAVKEAVVAGVPVVASEVGGIVDYVWPGRNGVLFRVADEDACLAAIQQAWKHPLFSRGLVDGDSLNKAREYLSAERMGRRFTELYRLTARATA
jgi:glycosyltransferase involved in cell wall biosynthesis